MTRPDDIPQDVWDAAGSIINGSGNWREDLSRLILAERERCARYNEQVLGVNSDGIRNPVN